LQAPRIVGIVELVSCCDGPLPSFLCRVWQGAGYDIARRCSGSTPVHKPRHCPACQFILQGSVDLCIFGKQRDRMVAIDVTPLAVAAAIHDRQTDPRHCYIWALLRSALNWQAPNFVAVT